MTYEDIEKLGERYFDVSIYEDGQEDATETFLCYGSVWDIVSTMDAMCDGLDYDVRDVNVCISYDFVGLVYGSHAGSPDDFEIICDKDYDELIDELAA